jgi:hypothetical protein
MTGRRFAARRPVYRAERYDPAERGGDRRFLLLERMT